MDLEEIIPSYPKEETQRTARAENIYGLFRSVTVYPTGTPKNFLDQIQIYRSGGTSQLVIYEPSTGIWKGVIVT